VSSASRPTLATQTSTFADSKSIVSDHIESAGTLSVLKAVSRNVLPLSRERRLPRFGSASFSTVALPRRVIRFGRHFNPGERLASRLTNSETLVEPMSRP
jgi:hypothetical protein